MLAQQIAQHRLAAQGLDGHAPSAAGGHRAPRSERRRALQAGGGRLRGSELPPAGAQAGGGERREQRREALRSLVDAQQVGLPQPVLPDPAPIPRAGASGSTGSGYRRMPRRSCLKASSSAGQLSIQASSAQASGGASPPAAASAVRHSGPPVSRSIAGRSDSN